MKSYQVTATGSFDDISDVIPAIAFVSHNRRKRFRVHITVEELDEE